jgi:hypothetical protein
MRQSKIAGKIAQVLLEPSFVGGRHNLWMNRTRVAPVKASKCARKSLAHFELCQRRPRADYLGRYTGFSAP